MFLYPQIIIFYCLLTLASPSSFTPSGHYKNYFSWICLLIHIYFVLKFLSNCVSDFYTDRYFSHFLFMILIGFVAQVFKVLFSSTPILILFSQHPTSLFLFISLFFLTFILVSRSLPRTHRGPRLLTHFYLKERPRKVIKACVNNGVLTASVCHLRVIR